MCTSQGSFSVFSKFAKILAASVALSDVGSSQASCTEFEVWGWYAHAPAEMMTVDWFRQARECGFTTLLQKGDDVQSLRRFLDMAHAANMKLGVQHESLWKDPASLVEELKDHPAVRFWYLKDEPSSELCARLADLASKIRSVDTNRSHALYVNLHPMNADINKAFKNQGVTNYVEYMERAVREIGLEYLSLDHYAARVRPAMPDAWPYVERCGREWYISENYYENLELASTSARRCRVPLSLFARATSFTCVEYDHPVPSEATLRLEVYSALAYGAKVIQYFTYYTPPSSTMPLRFHDGCIAEDGRRGLAFDRVKRMNRELHRRADGLFTDTELVCVGHTEPVPANCSRIMELPPFVEKLEAKGALVSVQRIGDETLLMIVNRNLNAEMRLDIEFKGFVRRVCEDGEVVSADRYGSVYLLYPGYAEIFLAKNPEQK